MGLPVARGAARGFGCAVFMVRCGVLAVGVFSSRLAVAVAGCSVSVGFRGCPPFFGGVAGRWCFAHASTNCQEHSTRCAICTPVKFAFSQVKIERQTKHSHGTNRRRGGCLPIKRARRVSRGQTSPAKPGFCCFPGFSPFRRLSPPQTGQTGHSGQNSAPGLCSFPCWLCVGHRDTTTRHHQPRREMGDAQR